MDHGSMRASPVHPSLHDPEVFDTKYVRQIRFERRTTDITCCILCIAFWVYIVIVTLEALHRGDPRRLYHGFDYKGHLCGVDPGFEDKPLLYWPRPSQMKYPVCLGHCPSSTLETVFVPSESAEILSEDEATQSRVWKVSQSQTAVETYESREMAGRFCIPIKHHGELKRFATAVVNEQIANPVGKVKQGASDLANAWLLLMFILPFAVLMGYAYLFFLKHCAGILTWVSLAGLFAGAIFVLCFCGNIVEDKDEAKAEEWLGKYTDNPMELMQIITYAALALIIILSFAICCLCKTISTILGCMEAACDAIWALPVLLPMPVVELSAKLVFCVIWAIFFAWIVSCGELQYKEAEYGEARIHGWVRHFHYTLEDKIAMGVYVFALFWGLETITSMIHFVIGYAVSIWYFTPCKDTKDYEKPYIPQSVGFEGAKRAFRFHLGSLSLGAGLVAVFRFLHTGLAFIHRQATATGNPAAKCLTHCCMCCVWCFEEVVRYINKNAMIQIVLKSEDFFTAAGSAFKLLAGASAEVAGLNGITVLFQVFGISSITSICSYFAYFVMTSGIIQPYSDPDSNFYIEEPLVVVVAAGFIGFLVSLAYMLVFDMVSDTLLLCWLADKEDGDAEFAPKPMRETIGDPRRRAHMGDKF